jgi:hypothetical protein
MISSGTLLVGGTIDQRAPLEKWWWVSLSPPFCGERVGVRGSLHKLDSRMLPLTRIAPDDAEPVIGRAFARPVGIAEAIRPLPASGARWH